MFILNKKIPTEKRVFVALTYVYGIGDSLAKKIAQEARVENKKIFQLTDEEVARLTKECERYILEDKLREEVQKKRNEKIRLGTYQGRRMEKGLPVRGQSTRHNARTAKRSKKKSGVKVVKKMIKTKEKKNIKSKKK